MAIQKPPVAPLYFSVVSLLLLRSFFPLFRTGPVSFNFFQRLSGGFRHKFPDNQHIRHAHDGEQEECSGGGKVLEHPWSELSDQVRPDPQGKSCNGHGQSAHLGGIHLREEHEYHGADGNGTAEYIEQEEDEQEEAGYSQGISEEEVQADENQRNNHSRNSVINKFLAAYLINDDKSQNGGQSID